MTVFDIIGPVMVGPSSSHTAGAVRIGRVGWKLLECEPVDIVIKFHGSFAGTYKGHGTDRAIIAGLMGMLPDDSRIRDSLKIADEKGIRYHFETIEFKDAHPNTAVIEILSRSGKKVSLLGSSIGGGNIIIRQINGMDVEFSGQYHTLIIHHKDAPGVIAAVTDILSGSRINIAQMKVFRSRRGGDAIMIIETDQPMDMKLGDKINKLVRIIDVSIIEPV